MNRFYDSPGDISLSLSPLELRKRGLTNRKIAIFELQEHIRFHSDIAKGDIVVPAGLVSDLASIPRFAWSIFMTPDDPRISLGAYVHDFLYTGYGKYDLFKDPLTRQQCDAILAFEAMDELGASKFQQKAVYYALRLFGRKWTENPFKKER